MKRLALLLCASVSLWCLGCTLPQWRIFQKIVPVDTGKPAAQVEGERRAAAYIVARTTPPVPDAARAVQDVHEVAAGLSTSLGQPAQTVTVEDREAVIKTLRAGNLAKDAKLQKYEEWSRKYGGTPLEDTGINLAGPAGFLGLLGVIALCIFFPAFGYVILRVLPVLWGFFSKTTEAIGEFAKANPDAGAKLATNLRGAMDSAQKALVRRRAKRNRIPEPIAHPLPISP